MCGTGSVGPEMMTVRCKMKPRGSSLKGAAEIGLIAVGHGSTCNNFYDCRGIICDGGALPVICFSIRRAIRAILFRLSPVRPIGIASTEHLASKINQG